MKTIVVLGLMASLMIAAPTFADTGADALCGPGGSEAHQRPGGYCDVIGANGSLSLPITGPADGPHYAMPPDEEEDDCLCAAGV